MRIEEQHTIELTSEALWGFLKDLPAVLRCVPGVQEVQAVDERTYTGVLAVKVGPISARFAGKAVVGEMDPARGQAWMTVEGFDSRIGSRVNGKMTLHVKEVGEEKTQLAVVAELNVLGVLGELGHWVMQKKARALMQGFAQELVQRARSG